MKCLSIAQPFADLVMSGEKTVELRTWNTRFRGEFLVHAPLRIRKNDCERLGMDADRVTGAIIGKAELYDVKWYGSITELINERHLHHAGADFEQKCYGFMVRNPRRLQVPIPYKGRLGLFEAGIPRAVPDSREITTDIIDEDARYRWIGRH